MKETKSVNLDNIDLHNTDLGKEEWFRQAVNFLRDNDIVSDYDVNLIILNTYMASDKIRYVELKIDRDSKVVEIYVFLSKFGYLFSRRKKILSKVLDFVRPVLPQSYKLNVKILLFSKYLRE